MIRKWIKNEFFLFRTQKFRAKNIPDLKKEINKKSVEN